MPVDEELLEAAAGSMQDALIHISQYDCLYADFSDDPDRPMPCDCSTCVAKRVLRQVKDWRRQCSRAYRLERNPRERKLVDAFLKHVDNRRLSQILDEEGKPPPSIRDWYVAVSVIRWLGTNVGSAVLQDADWQYTKYVEDREERARKQNSEERTCEHPEPVPFGDPMGKNWRP